MKATTWLLLLSGLGVSMLVPNLGGTEVVQHVTKAQYSFESARRQQTGGGGQVPWPQCVPGSACGLAPVDTKRNSLSGDTKLG
jgi:hypothetical protein